MAAAVIGAGGDEASELRREKLESSPPTSLRFVMGALNVVMNAEEEVPRENAEEAKVRGCSARFLLSILSLDSFSWTTGKIFQYETLLLADKLGFCYVLVSLVLTSSEIFTEFLASALTPFFYTRIQGVKASSCQHLVAFAVKAYAASNAMAVLIYPIFGLVIHVLRVESPAMVYLLLLVRTLHYSFLNQLGDQAVEMSRPHWLLTFKGMQLQMPGICCRSLLQREASPRSLAYYITFLRFMIMGATGFAYVTFYKNIMLRWCLAGICLVWNAYASFVLLRNLPILSMGIVEAEGAELAQTRPGFRNLRSLSSPELSWLFFVVIIYGVRPQAMEAFQSVLVLEMSSLGLSIVLFCGAFLILASLAAKIYRLPKVAVAEKEDAPIDVAEVHERSNAMFLKGWLLPLASIVVLLGAGFALAVGIGGEALMAAMAIFVAVGPLDRFIRAHVDTFLLCYNPIKGSDLVFWLNVLIVLINVPLLAVNWMAAQGVGCNVQAEGTELDAAIAVMGIGVGSLAAMCFYFACVEPFLPARFTLRRLVDETLSGQAL